MFPGGIPNARDCHCPTGVFRRNAISHGHDFSGFALQAGRDGRATRPKARSSVSPHCRVSHSSQNRSPTGRALNRRRARRMRHRIKSIRRGTALPKGAQEVSELRVWQYVRWNDAQTPLRRSSCQVLFGLLCGMDAATPCRIVLSLHPIRAACPRKRGRWRHRAAGHADSKTIQPGLVARCQTRVRVDLARGVNVLRFHGLGDTQVRMAHSESCPSQPIENACLEVLRRSAAMPMS